MRKSIVIFGIILSFILGSLVSAPSVAAPQGEPFVFLEGEIGAIKLLIEELNAKLENVVVKWDNVADKPYEVLHYEQSTEVELKLSEFIIFAEWEIVKTGGASEYDRVLYDSSVYANIEGNVEIGWYRSDDGTTWDFFEGFSVSNTTFETKQEFKIDNTLASKYNFIAFAAKNTVDEAVLGKVKDFSGTVTIHLPGNESLVKLP